MPEPADHRSTERPVREILDVLQAMGAGIFGMWRRALAFALRTASITSRGVRAGARRWWAQWPAALLFLRDPAAADPAGVPARTAAAIGMRGFAFGVIVAGVVASVGSSMWVAGAFTTLTEVLWAGARLAILALLLPARAAGRGRLATAFASGLLPYALGATPLLRLAALGISAWLTYRALAPAAAPRDARTAVVWAFGGQTGAMALGWLGRAAMALLGA